MDKTRWGRFFTLLFKRAVGPVSFVISVVGICVAGVLWGQIDYWPLGIEGREACAGLMVVIMLVCAAFVMVWSAIRSVCDIWQDSEEE